MRKKLVGFILVLTMVLSLGVVAYGGPTDGVDPPPTSYCPLSSFSLSISVYPYIATTKTK